MIASLIPKKFAQAPIISNELRMGIATLSYNRAFSTRDLADYRGLSTYQAGVVVRKLKSRGFLRKMKDGWYPTSMGWAWIEGRPFAASDYDMHGMRK